MASFKLNPITGRLDLVGSGGTPGGSNTQVQFNDSSAFGGDSTFIFNKTSKTLSALNQNFNGKQVSLYTTAPGVISSFNRILPAPTTPLMLFLVQTGSTLGGIDATGATAGSTVTIQNNTAIPITITQEDSTVSANNRILTGLGDIQLGARGMLTLIYNTQFAASRWMAQIPFGVISAATQTFNGQKTFNGGIIVNTSFQVNGNGVVTGSLTADSLIAQTIQAFQSITTPLITATATDQSTGNVSSPTASLILATPLIPTTGAVATQSNPHLQRPSSIGAVADEAFGVYISDGSTYEYTVYSWNSSNNYVAVVNSTTGAQVDPNDGLPFGWHVTWASDAPGNSRDSVDGYFISLSINGSGTVYQFVGNTNSFDDDGAQPYADSLPGAAPDYIANGTMRNYSVSTANDTTPLGESVTYFSSANTYNRTDNNSGDAYNITHDSYSSFSGSDYGRFLGDAAGGTTNHYDTTAASFIEDSALWISGNTVTPTTYGIEANGANLNFDFLIYGRQTISAQTVYSAVGAHTNTTDPNDGLFYYVELAWTPGVGNADWKILESTDGGITYPVAKITAVNPYDFDVFATWPDSPTPITPTSVPANAGIFQSDALSTLDGAQVVIKSTGASYGRIDFLDAANNPVNAIESDTTGLNIIMNGVPAFTGTGIYTNFTIVGGIITNAS